MANRLEERPAAIGKIRTALQLSREMTVDLTAALERLEGEQRAALRKGS